MQLAYFFSLLAAASVIEAHPSQARSLVPRRSFPEGKISFFTQQGTYGSCGGIHEDTEHVVALSYKLQGTTYPPSLCGQSVRITHVGADRQPDGSLKDKVIEAKVVDTCTTCDSHHLELSVAAFEALLGGTWDNPGPQGHIRWDFI